MKQRFIVDVEVAEGTHDEDVANDIKLALTLTDGEQHVEAANWEPIPMSDVKVQPAFKGPDPKMKDIDKDHCVRVVIDEHRQKIFSFNVPEGKDVGDHFWDCAEKVKQAYDRDHDILADAETYGFEYNDPDCEFDWKEHFPNLPGFDCPEENGDWMFEEDH